MSKSLPLNLSAGVIVTGLVLLFSAGVVVATERAGLAAAFAGQSGTS
jgi:hypothetical protein